MAPHLYNGYGHYSFCYERLRFESDVINSQLKTHLPLQALQPCENDGTERTTEEGIEIHGDGTGLEVRLSGSGRDLVGDRSVTEELGETGEEMIQRPPQRRHARNPQCCDRPLVLICEVRDTGRVR